MNYVSHTREERTMRKSLATRFTLRERAEALVMDAAAVAGRTCPKCKAVTKSKAAAKDCRPAGTAIPAGVSAHHARTTDSVDRAADTRYLRALVTAADHEEDVAAVMATLEGKKD